MDRLSENTGPELSKIVKIGIVLPVLVEGGYKETLRSQFRLLERGTFCVPYPGRVVTQFHLFAFAMHLPLLLEI